MSVKRIAGNVVWNCAGMAANLMAGFVVVPFLVRHLGQTVYGLWILVASFTNYFSLLDLGIRAAVGRHIAYHKAKNDVEGFNATVNTAMLILGACGVLALLATMGVMLIFFRLYAVPPEQAAAVRIALVLVGVNLLLWLPLNMFDAMLWAMQRFDLINIVDISGALLRVALIFWWVGRGGGLVALAVIQLLSLAGMQAIKAAVAIRLDRTLRISFRHITKIAARGLAGMGFWNLMLAAADIIGGEAPPMIVGARLGVPMVTPYSIAARLVAYGRDFLVASTGVLTPMAIANHAEEKHANQRTLFIEGSKFCLAMAVLCVVAFVVLGKTIIGLWVGPSLENSSRLLVILVIGEALPMSQWVAYSIILGQYHHRILGQINLLDICLSVCLALLLVGHWGLVGVCIGFVLPGMFLRGIFQLVFACRLVNVSAGEYFRRVAAPVLTAALLPAIGLALLSRWRRPESWLELFLYGGLFAVAYMAVMAPALGYHTAVRRHLALRSDAPPEVASA
jgi:O-antigen/teichoic acid export membrane protein